MNGLLTLIIAKRGGFFRRSDALDCGENDRTLRAAMRAKLIVRLRHGAYAMAADYNALTERERHVVLIRAAVAAQRGQVAVAGHSAAILHGFTVYGHDLGQVHLVRLDRGSGRRESGVIHHVHGGTLESDTDERDGLVVLKPARTAWDVACVSTLEGGVVLLDSVLKADADVAEALRALERRYAYHPGSRVAREAMSLADSRSDSAGESVTRVQYHRFGIPKPELQYKVHVDGRLVGISDFYWPEFRHLGEFDGRTKYERYLRPGETSSDCVFREKRREDLMRGTGRGMTRFVWAGVMPGAARQTMASLRQDLERSKRLYVGDRAS